MDHAISEIISSPVPYFDLGNIPTKDLLEYNNSVEFWYCNS
jgi:hypothetical protein